MSVRVSTCVWLNGPHASRAGGCGAEGLGFSVSGQTAPCERTHLETVLVDQGDVWDGVITVKRDAIVVEHADV